MRCWWAIVLVGLGCQPPTPEVTPSGIVFVDRTFDRDIEPQASLCLVARDMDGDRYPDIVLGAVDTSALRLYHNRGGSRFAMTVVPLPDGMRARQCVVGQFVGSPALDLFVLDGVGARSRWALLESINGREFIDRSASLPAAPPGLVLATAIDAGLDGRADIYIAAALPKPLVGEGEARPVECDSADAEVDCQASEFGSTQSVLLRNLGPHFALEGLRVSDGITRSAFVHDVDGDGTPEIVEAVDGATSRRVLFDRDGRASAALLPGADDKGRANGIAADDFDLDGSFDLLFTGAGPGRLVFGPTLSKDEYAPSVSEATRLGIAWGPIAGDFDNDGDIDALVPNTLVAPTDAVLASQSELGAGFDPALTAPHDVLLTNEAVAGATVKAGTEAVYFAASRLYHRDPSMVADAMAVAMADFDGDGGLDLVVVAGEPTHEVRLLMNESDTRGRYLRVRPVSTSGKSLAGAIVVASTTPSRPDVTRAVGGCAGGASDPVAHFGLGDSTSFQRIEVRVPGARTVFVKGPFLANSTLLVPVD